MGKPIHIALDDWRDADLNAHEGERALRAAWAAFHEGKSPPPAAALIARVARLRRVATLRLAQCVESMQPSPSDLGVTTDFALP